MCLAVPLRIEKIDGFVAYCESRGIPRVVSLFLLQDEALREGDYVLAHLEHAVKKISETEALSIWELLDQL